MNYNLGLFLINPLLSLFSVVRSKEIFNLRTILWMFCGYYGFTFIITSEGQDAFYYAKRFTDLHNLDLSLWSVFALLYKDGNVDIFNTLIATFIGYFTSDSKFLFGAYGLIFGYFYSTNIFLVLKYFGWPKDALSITYFILFVLIIGIWQINGFRFWTSAQIYVSGLLCIILERKKVLGWMFVFLTPLMHFSFFTLIPITILGYLIKVNWRILFVLYILTLFISDPNIFGSSSVLSYFPDVISQRVSGYLNEAVITQIEELKSVSNLNWYILFLPYLIKILILFPLGVMFFSVGWHDKIFTKLLSVSLVLAIFGNIISLFPSGGRFVTIATIISFVTNYHFFMTFGLDLKGIKKKVVQVLPFASVIIILVQVRLFLESFSLLGLIGNPLIALFVSPDLSVLNILKSVF